MWLYAAADGRKPLGNLDRYLIHKPKLRMIPEARVFLARGLLGTPGKCFSIGMPTLFRGDQRADYGTFESLDWERKAVSLILPQQPFDFSIKLNTAA